MSSLSALGLGRPGNAAHFLNSRSQVICVPERIRPFSTRLMSGLPAATNVGPIDQRQGGNIKAFGKSASLAGFAFFFFFCSAGKELKKQRFEVLAAPRSSMRSPAGAASRAARIARILHPTPPASVFLGAFLRVKVVNPLEQRPLALSGLFLFFQYYVFRVQSTGTTGVSEHIADLARRLSRSATEGGGREPEAVVNINT